MAAKKKVKASTVRNKADRLFSKLIRGGRSEVDDGQYEGSPICMAVIVWNPQGILSPQCKGNLQCAHIIGRSWTATRLDLANAVPLCAGHHKQMTHDPWLHVRFFDALIRPKEHDRLREKAAAGIGGAVTVKWWQSELERLQKIESEILLHE